MEKKVIKYELKVWYDNGDVETLDDEAVRYWFYKMKKEEEVTGQINTLRTILGK